MRIGVLSENYVFESPALHMLLCLRDFSLALLLLSKAWTPRGREMDSSYYCLSIQTQGKTINSRSILRLRFGSILFQSIYQSLILSSCRYLLLLNMHLLNLQRTFTLVKGLTTTLMKWEREIVMMHTCRRISLEGLRSNFQLG